MRYIISFILLIFSSIFPSTFRPERTTIGHTSQDNATRMREGTKQMREGLKFAALPVNRPSSKTTTPRLTNQLLTITKKPIHLRQ